MMQMSIMASMVTAIGTVIQTETFQARQSAKRRTATATREPPLSLPHLHDTVAGRGACESSGQTDKYFMTLPFHVSIRVSDSCMVVWKKGRIPELFPERSAVFLIL